MKRLIVGWMPKNGRVYGNGYLDGDGRLQKFQPLRGEQESWETGEWPPVRVKVVIELLHDYELDPEDKEPPVGDIGW